MKRSGTAFLSVETLRLAQEVEGGFDNMAGLGVSVAGVMDPDGTFAHYHADDEDAVVELSRRLNTADILVGYGIKRFDIEVLTGLFPNARVLKARSVDLLELFVRTTGKRVTLRNLARHTLGRELPSGLQSPLEWRVGNRGQVIRRLGEKLDAIRELYLISRGGGEWTYAEMDNGRMVRRNVSIILPPRCSVRASAEG